MCRLRWEYKQTTISIWQGGVVGSGLQTHALPPVLALCTSILFLQFRFWWALEKDRRRSLPRRHEKRGWWLWGYFTLLAWSPDQPSMLHRPFFVFPIYPLLFSCLFSWSTYFISYSWAPCPSLPFDCFLSTYYVPNTVLHSGAQKGTKDKLSALKGGIVKAKCYLF